MTTLLLLLVAAAAVQALLLGGAALGAVLVAVLVVLCYRSRRGDRKGRHGEYDSLGPSIVVYPSYHGKGPQFL